MERERRIEYIDFFRGIGIILMIMNHVDFGGVLYNFSHAFHMPMFFILSGFLYRKKTEEQLPTGAFLRKKAKSLLLPYGAMGILHYLIWICLYGFSPEPLKYLFFFNTEDGMPIAGALWFLTALFLAEILYFTLDRYLKNRIVFLGSVVVLSLFGTAAGILLPFPLPFALSAGLVGVGLFGIGVLLKRGSELAAYRRFDGSGPILRAAVISLLAVLTLVLIYLNGPVNMRVGKYSFLPLFWINAALATTAGMLASKLWLALSGQNLLNRWICGVGRESIVYLCLNQVTIFWVNKAAGALALPFLIKQLIVLLAVLLILWLLCRIIFSTKLKILFGK